MPRISLQKHQEDINAYKGEMEHYKLYAEVLKNLLQKAVDLYARDGIVQARPKSIESFSEKIIRKDKYKNPLLDMTDLCGARVIVHFESQVQSICNFIQSNFEIDEANSIDVKTRLKMSEFGYRSVHYIVTPRRAEILGVSIPEVIQNKKAEIQVRTFNEHVWADILHDRIYKTRLRVPSGWQRESARLAAVLEEVDNSFKTISETLDQFSVNYRPTPTRTDLENEVFILKTLIDVNKDFTDKSVIQYLKLSLVFNLRGQWKEITDLLEQVYKKLDLLKNVELRARVKLEYGYALGKLNRRNPEVTGFELGIAMIKDALQQLGGNPKYYLDISKANFYLAILNDIRNNDSDIVSGYLLQAVKYSPDNPYYLIRSIIEECSIGKDPEKSVNLFAPQLKKIIGTCKDHIDIGIEVPEAYIVSGISYLLLGDENNCALNFIELLLLLQQRNLPVSEDTINDAIGLVSKIGYLKKHIVTGLLQLIAWKQFGSHEADEYLAKLRSNNMQYRENVLIIAGLSRKFSQPELENYGSYIHEALIEYTGDVISGGTGSGLPGLVGTEAGDARNKKNKGYRLYGYLPGNLSDAKALNHQYDRLIASDSDHFSFADVFQYWVDILWNETPVQNIMLLGINGGEISEIEYKMAVALEVKTALILDSGGAVDNILRSRIWSGCANLITVPQDPQTVWALVMHYRKSVMDVDKLQSMVQLVHEDYRTKRLKNLNPATNDINKLKEIMEWQYLDPNLKASNLKQLEFMEHLLRKVGLGIRKADRPQPFLIPEDLKNMTDFDALARLEHARWNAERLLDGWKYGPVKDVNNKISPYLISWDKLDDETKSYDYDPVRKFPELLGRMGYEIYKM